MRLLGQFFVIVGLLLCLTFIFLTPGLLTVGVGALLLIASPKPQERTQGSPRTTADLVFWWVLIVLCAIYILHEGTASKPTPHHSTTVVHDVCPPAGPLAEPCRANQHKATR